MQIIANDDGMYFSVFLECVSLLYIYFLLNYVVLCWHSLCNINRINNILFKDISYVFYVRIPVILRSCSTEVFFDIRHTFIDS